jgi:hypothetical protein
LGIGPPTSSLRFWYLSTIIQYFSVIADQLFLKLNWFTYFSFRVRGIFHKFLLNQPVIHLPEVLTFQLVISQLFFGETYGRHANAKAHEAIGHLTIFFIG